VHPTNIVKAESKNHLRELLESDYRGLIITTIHKFEGMPKHVNERDNIIVLVDEAHRSQEGDLGNYMRGALPNAYYFGFTGTPIDRTKVGKGTFKAFGYPPNEPYLDKYTINESIEDGTTVPLYYKFIKTERCVDRNTLEEEFFRVVEEEGIASIEGINRVIERAEKLKAVLKAKDGIDKIAKHIAEHHKKFVEPLGFKAFIVAVDREACALYKEAIDKYLPEEYTKVVYTPDYKDNELLKKYYISDEKEKRMRKDFKSADKLPKILIVTEKLLTGYDAPILYVMDIARTIKADKISQRVKIASLYKSIKVHIENKRKESPYLVSIAEKIEEIISQLRERQRSVESALEELTRIAEDIAKAEEEQKKSGLNKEEFSYFWILRRHGVKNPEEISKGISNIIAKKEHWIFNENVERELRKKLYKKLLGYSYSGDVVKLVNELLDIDRIIRGET